MNWKPDRAHKLPIYKQISHFIEEHIVKGIYQPNKTLPTERALAAQLGVNRSTVVAAYSHLASLGIIERVQGKGTMVSEDIWRIPKVALPNWGHYTSNGDWEPNLLPIQKLRWTIERPQIINLASGELAPSLLPQSKLTALLHYAPKDIYLGHEHPQGTHQLRETLSSFMQEHSAIESLPSSILITSGAQQAIHLIVQGLLKKGDAVAIERPSYFYSLPVFKSAGLRVYPLDVDENGANPSQLIEWTNKHHIRMVFLNPTHQNPTGSTMSNERREAFLEYTAKRGIPLVEDDPYTLLSFSNKHRPRPLRAQKNHAHVLYISSLSKTVAAGMRIGWIVGPEQVIHRLTDVKQQIDFGQSPIPQWLAHTYIEEGSFTQHVSFLKNQLVLRRDLLQSELKKRLPHELTWHSPSGGIHLWVHIRGAFHDRMLLEKSLEYGLAFTPGNVFGASSNRYVRLTYARAELHEMNRASTIFSQALEATHYLGDRPV